jgi:fatty-acyl-CoA synthase/long-chain acyl-CoA synthetase
MTQFSHWNEVMPIGDLLVRGASLHPQRDAIVMPGARESYAGLLQGATRIARGLVAVGVRPGDRVAFLANNSVEFIEGLFGAALLGCVSVPLHARHRANELGYILKNAEVAALFTTSTTDEYVDFSAVLRSALPSLDQAKDPSVLQLPEVPSLRAAILLRGSGKQGFVDRAEFDRCVAAVDPTLIDAMRQCVRVRDVAMILYTSGTTANPKGCMLSHEAMTRGAVHRARERFWCGDHNVTWGAGPLYHIGSLAPFLGSMGAVGTYLTDVFFEPGRALELMTRERVTAAWPWFPAIVQGLLDHPTFDPALLSSLRKMLLICPPTLMRRIQSLFPQAEVLQACGMTETAGIFALSDPTDTPEQRATTQGRAAPGIEVRIVDIETGAEVAPGEVGEILVRGHCVMEGYFRDPEKTAAALDAERWLHTGDLYRRDADGNLVFNGRLKDMLKVGGENVAAIEVESFLCRHPGVRLAEVIGMPDPRLDEVPVAFVERRSGSTVQAQELIEFCRGRIANYKIPRAIHFMEPADWPMSATKVNKQVLRERLARFHSQ